MAKKKTAGALSLKAASDTSKYDGREVAEAQLHDYKNQALENAHAHLDKFDEDEYFVIMQRASDPLIAGVVRQKYYSYRHLPSPRPEQAVWLYNKVKDTLRFLWSLPPAKVMAAITEAPYVSAKWKTTRNWCDSFFNKTFWTDIRKQHNIKHFSETEMLQIYREKLIDAGCKETDSITAEPFDFSKVAVNKVIDPINASTT